MLDKDTYYCWIDIPNHNCDEIFLSTKPYLSCVIDENVPEICDIAMKLEKEHKTKEDCEFWHKPFINFDTHDEQA